MFPIALGAGDRLIADQLATYTLTGYDVYDDGVVHLCLVPRG